MILWSSILSGSHSIRSQTILRIITRAFKMLNSTHSRTTVQELVALPQDVTQTEVKENYKVNIKWKNVWLLLYFHIAACLGFMQATKFSTWFLFWTIGILTGIGTTAGSHRLYTHRTYKANKKLRVILVILQTIGGQEPILKWVRDHRVHHKYTDTDADPHNSTRGFFFSHIGWLMCQKHPEVVKKGKLIEMNDVESDGMLLFQRKYYTPLYAFFCYIFPIALMCYFGESFTVAWNLNMFRYMVVLHIVWSLNSVAHLWGSKPFDASISPTDTHALGFAALGEGWHNYHHTFPWDYKTSETPAYFFNLSTGFIDLFAYLGWATELKTVPDNIIRTRVLRTGDGSHKYSQGQKPTKCELNCRDDKNVENLWGFGDNELDLANVKIIEKMR